MAVLGVLAVGLAVADETRGPAAPLASVTSSPGPAGASNASPPVTTGSARGAAPSPVQVGSQLYSANCQTCHGKDGQGGQYRGIHGTARMGFARFKRLILYGNEGMPGYAKTGLSTSNNLGKLGAKGYLGGSQAPTDTQIQDLLAYLETLPGANRGGFFGGDD